jgi:phage baseplate assembly protein gpV
VVLHLNEDGATGYIAGSIYSEVDTPSNALADADISGVEFEDGSLVYYDQGNSKLVVDSSGSVEVTAATEFVATVGTAEVKATTGGLTIKFAGISLKTILSDMLNALAVETHATPAGPSSPPTNVASYAAALAKVNTIFEA